MCDADKLLLKVNIGQSGWSHDCQILYRSKLAEMIMQQKVILPDYHLLGDAADGLSTNVLVSR